MTTESSIEDSSLEGSDECILRTHELTLSYGKNLAVNALSLNVRRGEIYGFLGRNGAGKTSTIRMIMGISKPDRGTIEFDGEGLRRIGNKQKRMIGYVSQEQFFYPWMTCQGIGKFVRGLFPTWDDGEFLRLMSVLELPHDRKIAHLSGGMRVKLALALALAHRPAILILDEPTAGLDPVARREFLDIIRLQAREHNRTTFFSSHLIDEVERVADRVGIIHRGRLQFEGPLDQLQDTVREISLEATEDAQAKIQSTIDCGLRYLRRGLDDRPTAIFQGTAEAWQAADGIGITSTSVSLEDAFIGLASEDMGRLTDQASVGA
jgi:ABC-2 type transport system ATP-binding protein